MRRYIYRVDVAPYHCRFILAFETGRARRGVSLDAIIYQEYFASEIAADIGVNSELFIDGALLIYARLYRWRHIECQARLWR